MLMYVVEQTVRRTDVTEELRMSDDTDNDYWSRKERYVQLTENSAVVWHKLYEEEKAKREELQHRYDQLTKQIRYQGKVKVDCGDTFLRNYARSWK